MKQPIIVLSADIYQLVRQQMGPFTLKTTIDDVLDTLSMTDRHAVSFDTLFTANHIGANGAPVLKPWFQCEEENETPSDVEPSQSVSEDATSLCAHPLADGVIVLYVDDTDTNGFTTLENVVRAKAVIEPARFATGLLIN